MRNLTKDNITEHVINTVANAPNPRTKEILTSLIKHLHGFVRDVNLTQEEWIAATDLLLRTGQVSHEQRNEFIIFSDTLGVSSLVDLSANQRPGKTDSSLLGPFYVEGSPERGFAADMVQDNPGTRVIVQGRVLGDDDEPVPGALLDIWQNADNGLYEVQDPDQPDGNLRCKTVSDDNGNYLFATIKPVPYKVPDDGPVGEMLRATDRHPWRCAHLHLKISADGYGDLITELFPSDDTYLDEDAVFGVRESLILPFRPAEDGEEPAVEGIAKPFEVVDFDFRLTPVGA